MDYPNNRDKQENLAEGKNKSTSNSNDHPTEESEELPSLPLLSLHNLLKVPLRFNIMFLLYNYERLGFTRMQKLLRTTPGNLDHHLKKLKEAGWIADSVFFSPRPLKTYHITPIGTDEFEFQISQLKRVLRHL